MAQFISMAVITILSGIFCKDVSSRKPAIGPAFYWFTGVVTGMINIIIFQGLA